MKNLYRLSIYFFIVVTLFSGSSLISGCSLIKMDQEIKEIDSAVTIKGNIRNAKNPDTPIVIGLFTKHEKEKYTLSQSSVVYGNSPFDFLVEADNYFLAAFADTNQDFTLQNNEWAAWYGKPSPLKVTSSKKTPSINLSLKPPSQINIDMPSMYNSNYQDVIALNNDKTLARIVKITDPLFSHSNGQMGLWRPLQFVNQKKHGIFLLQEYDPTKIPILFFHGIGGSGADLKTLISEINTEKFQPWVMQYPSGLRLDLVASHFSGEMNKYRSKFQFDQYAVIAHSMGGLVARSFIEYQIAQQRNVDIPLFISISTPWNGHKAATWGVESAPVVIPVWFDIVPGSPYLKKLHKQITKGRIKHYLLFSYKGRLSLINSENNDGTVTISSELPLTIQQKAEKVVGFDVDHVGILEHQETLKEVNDLLSQIAL